MKHLLPVLVALLAASSARAATWSYYLRAGVTQIPAGAYSALPLTPNENVLMWGYSQCTDNTFAHCGAVTFPGPRLVASEGDTLEVTLQNALTPPAGFPLMISEPTSVVVMGQVAAMTPVWVSVNATGGVTGVTSSSTGSRPAGDTTSRVRSFTTETAVGATTKYTWSALRPGTFLYESGTHLAVQVQMGLAGALVVYPSATPAHPGSPAPSPAQAYDSASTAFDAEATLVYSEVDPELHFAIASGRYGTPPPAPPAVKLRGQMTSTVHYLPRFFLVNGAPNPLLAPIAAGQVGKHTLLRVVNAGLKEKTPTLLDHDLGLIAEDGNPYHYLRNGIALPAPRQQDSFLLPAGKTIDAIFTPVEQGNVPFFDRALSLTNGAGPGGQLAYLAVAAAPAVPIKTGGPGAGGLTVTQPDAGADWRLGSVHAIVWNSPVDPGSVRLELVRNGRVVRVLMRAARGSAGAYLWAVPTSLPTGSGYAVRVSGATVQGQSGELRLSPRRGGLFGRNP